MELSDAPGNCFLGACPGAGKTHHVVGRFIRITGEQRRQGVGLLSFSNAAVDEARTRCASRPSALRPPNFVGTFDSFIHRFIVTPSLVSRGIRPRYIDSWSDLDSTTIRLTSKPALGFKLEWFDFAPDGSCALDVDRPHPGMWTAHASFYAQNADILRKRASGMWSGLVNSGMFSCSAARTIASGTLMDPDDRKRIAARLRGRFHELIVDEMQDCGPDELEILALCHAAGVSLVLVADLEQAIYEFRNAVPERVSEFSSRLTPLEPLTVNRRSGPAISQLNTSLRHGRTLETSLRDDPDHPIVVLVGGSHDAVRTAFHEQLADTGIVPVESIVLSHRWKDALLFAGQAKRATDTGDRVARLAMELRTLSSPTSSSRDRQRASEWLSRCVLGFLGFTGLAELSEILSDAGINPRWYSRVIATLVHQLAPKVSKGRHDFTTALKDLLLSYEWPSTCGSLKGVIRTPTESSWQVVDDHESIEGALCASTIHAVKGQEFKAVLVALPDDLRVDDQGNSVLDHWESDFASEERRVMYVGMSRASHLVAVRVPNARGEQVERILTSLAIPSRIVPLD